MSSISILRPAWLVDSGQDKERELCIYTVVVSCVIVTLWLYVPVLQLAFSFLTFQTSWLDIQSLKDCVHTARPQVAVVQVGKCIVCGGSEICEVPFVPQTSAWVKHIFPSVAITGDWSVLLAEECYSSYLHTGLNSDGSKHATSFSKACITAGSLHEIEVTYGN